MATKDIICICGDHFFFTDKDQKYFTDNGWPEPKRCKPCRVKKKEMIAEREKKDAFQQENYQTNP